MSPSLEFLDSFYEKQQANAPKYLQDVYYGYSVGESRDVLTKRLKGTNQQRED